jgi:hypothetical protein
MVWYLIKEDVFMEWHLVKYRDNFAFIFTYIIRVMKSRKGVMGGECSMHGRD